MKFRRWFCPAIWNLLQSVWKQRVNIERTLLRTPETTVVFTSQMIDALNRYLAPALPRHGVLMEIWRGCADYGRFRRRQERNGHRLVKRGHRLIADDAVEISRVSDVLTGTAPG